MHRARRLLEYFNYMVDCLGFFSGKNLNEFIKIHVYMSRKKIILIASVIIKVLSKILLPAWLAEFFLSKSSFCMYFYKKALLVMEKRSDESTSRIK